MYIKWQFVIFNFYFEATEIMRWLTKMYQTYL